MMTGELNQKLEEEVKLIKEKLKELHANKNIEKVKEELRNILISIKPWEIPLIEQSLIKEGVTITQVAEMCNLHVELFREQLAAGGNLAGLPRMHPLDILIKENDELLKDSEKITLYVKEIGEPKSDQEMQDRLKELKEHLITLLGLKKHYSKQQMLLFPYLERRGITAVPRVLWTKEDEIFDKLRNSLRITNRPSQDIKIPELKNTLTELSGAISDQIFRENKILYPTCWTLFTPGEWAMIQDQTELIGYYKVKPTTDVWKANAKPLYPYDIDGTITSEQILKLPEEMKNTIKGMPGEVDKFTPAKEGTIRLDDGYLFSEEIDAILKTLPFELTFIDKDERLRYFTYADKMLFVRTRTTLGRKVELCHPPSSVHIIKKIVEGFKAGNSKVAEFRINMGGRMIYIRYFPVWGKNKEYLGALEVVQDITDIKKVEGERRLTDVKV